jgi:molybdopterin-binding protein
VNKLKATIVNIESSEHISLVDLRANGDLFSCVIIETEETADYLRIGNQVHILFKETEVSIGKNLSGEISLRNRIHATIKQIDKGAVLCKIILDYKEIEIGSVITTRSANKLQLNVGDRVVGLVKANEVSIMEGETPWNSVGNR